MPCDARDLAVKIVMISRKKVCFQFGFDYFLELGRTQDRGGADLWEVRLIHLSRFIQQTIFAHIWHTCMHIAYMAKV